MIKRFLLNRVHTKAAGSAIGRQDNLILVAGTDKAQSPLPLMKLTQSWTKIALHTTIFQLMPILSGMMGGLGVHVRPSIYKMEMAKFLAIQIRFKYNTKIKKVGRNRQGLVLRTETDSLVAHHSVPLIR